MYKDYDWFLAELEAQGGIMKTDFATVNYITMEELDTLENSGIIIRRTTPDGILDIITTAKQYMARIYEE